MDDRRQIRGAATSSTKLPPGYRFIPTDYELIFYLQNKISNGSIMIEEIPDVDLYKNDPKTLSEMYPPVGDKKWYFFTSRNRKYPKGERPNRSVGSGYWKPTDRDRRVYYKGEVVGSKKTLVFQRGNHQNSIKTNWIMHEFRVNGQSAPTKRDANDNMKLDDWVLCRIHEKASRSLKGNQQQGKANHQVEESSNTPNYISQAVEQVKITDQFQRVVDNNIEEDVAALVLAANHDSYMNSNLAASVTPENMDDDQILDEELRAALDSLDSNPDCPLPTDGNQLLHTNSEQATLMSLDHHQGVVSHSNNRLPLMENHQIINQQPAGVRYNHGNFHHQRVSNDHGITFHQQGIMPFHHGNFHQQFPAYYGPSTSSTFIDPFDSFSVGMMNNPDFNQLLIPRRRRC